MGSTLSSISDTCSSGIKSSWLSSSLTLSLLTSFLLFILAKPLSFSSSLGKTISLRCDVEISDFQPNNTYFQYYKLIHFRFSPKYVKKYSITFPLKNGIVNFHINFTNKYARVDNLGVVTTS